MPEDPDEVVEVVLPTWWTAASPLIVPKPMTEETTIHFFNVPASAIARAFGILSCPLCFCSIVFPISLSIV